MNTLIKRLHPETHEIIANARYACYEEESITEEEYHEIIRSCFEAEAADRLKGMYHETHSLQTKA
jgi:hypothetical protein